MQQYTTHHRPESGDPTASQVIEASRQASMAITRRIRDIDTREVAEAARGHPSALFVDLPVAAQANMGWVIFVTNGRKAGEGVGAGTGVMAYSDSNDWFRMSDDTIVAV